MDSCVDFLQRLIQTPSLPEQEGDIARLVKKELEFLAFDEVWQDRAGNVIGLIRGKGEAPSLMFNTHLDHVSVGEASRWKYPPYGGLLEDGRIFGRGAVDIKGPLAAQIYGIGRLAKEGITPAGDVYVTCVVQEEVGGLGAQYLCRELKTDLVVVGEPSRNQLRIGHRGRTEIQVKISGKSAHASAPERGVNPLSVVARFLLGLERLSMRYDAALGPSSVVPTLIRTDQTSANVIPGEVVLTCDWRNVPGENSQQIKSVLAALAGECLIEGAVVQVDVAEFDRRSYTGYTERIEASHPAFSLAPDHPAVVSAKSVLEKALGERVEPGIWKFATDGGYFNLAGMTVIGFGPGDDGLAHTFDESIGVDELLKGEDAFFHLAVEWPCETTRRGWRPPLNDGVD